MDRALLLDNILRLAKAESTADAETLQEIRPVRERLEESIGRTVRQADASRFLGVSAPALKKWIESGDLPGVITPSGRREIPLTELIRLRLEVDRARTRGRERALAAVMRERREAAASLDLDEILPRRRARTHRYPELQSLAYHRAIARRLNEDMVEDARVRLERWAREGLIDPRWEARWRQVLDQPTNEIVKVLTSDTKAARELRQSSPFAGQLTEQERRRIADAVEARGA